VALLVLKVGGSLYDLPDLGPRLQRFLAALGEGPRLLVPGGGPTADVVRAFDRDHHLGPEPSHWLALRACTLNAHFLARLLPGARVVPSIDLCHGLSILDPFAFIQADDGRLGCLPHHWDATSDSVAARAAVVARAGLVLLKSITLPEGISWAQAAKAGHVDPVFPAIVAAAGLSVRAINFRDWPG
jgi:aspartokinase-like uncharacterized kinase